MKIIVYIAIVFLCLASCVKSNKEISAKDEQIATLTKQLEFYTSENDSYTTESGFTLTIEGGKVMNVTDEIVEISALENKAGFSVWKKDGKVYSGEPILRLPLDSIEQNSTYTALYNCIGILAVSRNLSNYKTDMSISEFSETTLFKAFYKFTPNNQSQKYLFTFDGGSNTFSTSIFPCDELDKQTRLNCYSASVGSGQISFFKIFMPENVDPYKTIAQEPDAEPVPLVDEEGNQMRSYTDDDARVFWMNTQTIGDSMSASACVSLSNQKEGEENETKKISLLLTK